MKREWKPWMTGVAVVAGWYSLGCIGLISEGYHLKDFTAEEPHGLNFRHWKTKIQKQRPSLAAVKLENDRSLPVAFFFDAASNELIACWYPGNYPFAIDSDSWRSVRGGNVGVIQFTDRCFDLLGRWFESSEVTGQSFPLKDRDVKTLGISLQRFPIVSGVPQPVIAHFRAQKSDADEWIVKKD